jgi:hypothetical protein
MKHQWVDYCLSLARTKADLYSGCRKIIRNDHWHISGEEFNGDLVMADCGFTKSKMSMLIRNYVHQESINVALKLWNERLAKGKYGSVGFTCYNHFVKGNIKGASPRGSKMGPCIQAVTLTLLDSKGKTSVDVFYRTTEMFKKFPADLVFIRDVLLPPFKIKNLEGVNFHFANITCHPMYYVTLIPHLRDWRSHLERLKRDKYFFDWVVKWTARYLVKEYFHGIEKFAQAMRVRHDALERIPKDQIKLLQRYLKENHPGYRGDKKEEEDDE